MPGTRGIGARAVGEQFGAVAEQRGGAAPVDLAQAVGEDPGDRPERVLVRAHGAGGVDDQPDVRGLDRRAHLAGDLPRVGADRPAGRALCLSARVGAPVEAPAGRALVDPARALRDRLAQAGGVAARLLDLVGERRAVDAAVGHPPARPSGPGAATARRSVAVAGGGQQGLEVEVLVELLELPGAGVLERVLERVGQRPDARLLAVTVTAVRRSFADGDPRYRRARPGRLRLHRRAAGRAGR